MDTSAAILQIITTKPGTSKEALRRQFHLSSYRLDRILRNIQRNLADTRVAHSEETGIWLVPMDPFRCSGLEWLGTEAGYAQCSLDPEFPDHTCWAHSSCMSLEMVAFERRLRHLAGSAEPSAYSLGHLNRSVVEEVLTSLRRIAPITRREERQKQSFLDALESTLLFLKRKELLRQHQRETWIPPELRDRHRRSSVNPFEFSIRKYFVILDVLPSATREEVIKAWRKLSRRFHPDTPNGDEERMKLINEAKDRIFRIRGWT